MLELFAPYMLFISFFITVLFNIWLISKNVNWIVLLIANLLLVLIMEFLGLSEYNFLNKIVEWIFDFLARIITGIFSGISDIVDGVWDKTVGGFFDRIRRIFGIPTTPGGTGSGIGGGGIRGR